MASKKAKKARGLWGRIRAWLGLWWRRLLIACVLVGLWLGVWAYLALRNLPDVKVIREGGYVIERERVRGKGAISFPVGPKWSHWTPLKEVSRFLVEAVVTAEDDLFFKHGGFNFESIRSSAEENLKRGRFARGGSTITQQLARNLFLSRRKTLTRKLQEAYLAFWIEVVFTKPEILELYLNVIEWGPDLYGVGPAVSYYFGVPPADLGLRESAFLAILLPSPKRYHRYAAEGLSPWAQEQVESVLLRMLRRKAISAEEYERATSERLLFRNRVETLPGD